MIESIRGILVHHEPTLVVLETQGVGYGIMVTTRTSEKISQEAGEIKLFTHLHVREDALELFGFQDYTEKKVFLKLISVSGVGPKMALRLLSEVETTHIVNLIVSGDTSALTKLKGIGKKTADILVANLRNQFSDINFSKTESTVLPGHLYLQESIQALIALGVKDLAAQKAIQKIHETHPEITKTSSLVSLALKIV